MTVQEALEKITKIEEGIRTVEGRINSYGREFPAHEPLNLVIDLLKDYRLSILQQTCY